MSELRNELGKWKNKTIGFVPTMGYLHKGHESLLHKAREECDCVVLSVFVNSLQFGVNEDIEIYPRDIERDAEVARRAEVDILFFPTDKEMYPNKTLTKIHIKKVTASLCGLSDEAISKGLHLLLQNYSTWYYLTVPILAQKMPSKWL